MTNERDEFERLLDILDQVMTKLAAVHAPARKFDTGIPLYRTEIHTIRAIGRHPGVNVTGLAELMGVTKGAASQTITKLVRKGLVRRAHVGVDARETTLELTDAGRTGFNAHERFHLQMLDIVRGYFGDQLKSKIDTFITVMDDLNEILNRFERRTGED